MTNKNKESEVSAKVERGSAEIRENQKDVLHEFSNRQQMFRNTYGVRQVASIPEHKKNPNLHYVKVTQDDVGTFLDRGYLIDTKLNGHISEDMIGRANKTGSVPNFGIGQDRIIVMCIPKEWATEREKAQAEHLDNKEAGLMGKRGDYNVAGTGISGKTREVDV